MHASKQLLSYAKKQHSFSRQAGRQAGPSWAVVGIIALHPELLTWSQWKKVFSSAMPRVSKRRMQSSSEWVPRQLRYAFT